MAEKTARGELLTVPDMPCLYTEWNRRTARVIRAAMRTLDCTVTRATGVWHGTRERSVRVESTDLLGLHTLAGELLTHGGQRAVLIAGE